MLWSMLKSLRPSAPKGMAGPRRLQPPGADIAEHIEHAPAGGVFVHGKPVAALVEEPAGLLTLAQRHLEAHPTLFEPRAGGHFADGFDRGIELLQFAHRGIVAQQHPLDVQHAVQRAQDFRLAALHASRGDLHHQHLAIAVDDQAGQAVALAIHQTVVRLPVQRLAQRQRRLQPLHEEILVEYRAVAASHESCADK